MLCIKCMRETDSTCMGCEEFESPKTHALNLAKSIRLAVKRHETSEISVKDWALVVAALEIFGGNYK